MLSINRLERSSAETAAPFAQRETTHGRIEVLGIPISLVTPRNAVETISRWIDTRQGRYVCAADMHSVMRARIDPLHRVALLHADMIVPDGMPVVWAARSRGATAISRTSGPDLVPLISAIAAKRKWRVYLYGGAEGIAETLGRNLSRSFPGLVIAGTYSPPFHEASEEEGEATIQRINSSRADLVWVGLGCPKQEIWMSKTVRRLDGAVLIGVGAAFDFHSGRTKRAPVWMRSIGLEWLHRLASEPGRLWRRYLVMGPQFVLRAVDEAWRLRR